MTFLKAELLVRYVLKKKCHKTDRLQEEVLFHIQLYLTLIEMNVIDMAVVVCALVVIGCFKKKTKQLEVKTFTCFPNTCLTEWSLPACFMLCDWSFLTIPAYTDVTCEHSYAHSKSCSHARSIKTGRKRKHHIKKKQPCLLR